jgi:hypothetical protein
MNIDNISEKITNDIIMHFRTRCSGNGYWYVEQEWYINKIIREHLKTINTSS